MLTLGIIGKRCEVIESYNLEVVKGFKSGWSTFAASSIASCSSYRFLNL